MPFDAHVELLRTAIVLALGLYLVRMDKKGLP
jgi:hypothetical protein